MWQGSTSATLWRMGKRILFIEPFYGGSHRQVADALRRLSSWEIVLATMPPRFWRWRRRLSAFEIVKQMKEEQLFPFDFDLLVVSDYVDIGDLKALLLGSPERTGAPGVLPPIAWYCHETQSTYPLPKGRTVEADVVAGDMRNALHADAIAFNSAFHRDAFFEVYRRHASLLRRWEPGWSVDSVAHKCRVIHPGIECPEEWDSGRGGALPDPGAGGQPSGIGPVILWNHRWEYDKNFGEFFRAATALANRDVPFRLAILGENPQAKPQTYLRARRELADRLVAFGYASDKKTYHRWLATSDIVVSTAIQENFGIAVLEAMSRGCIPVLPRRLAYPEILPQRFHDSYLYDGARELEHKLEGLIEALSGTAGPAPDRQEIAAAASLFCWHRRIEEFDRWFEETTFRDSGRLPR